MITDEIVERVAREASIADGQNPDKLSHNSFAWWRHYVPVARAALSAALSVEQPTPQQHVKTLEWVEGSFISDDDDNGPLEGVPVEIKTWSAGPYRIIRQRHEDGLFILEGLANGCGSMHPLLEQAQAAAEDDLEHRHIRFQNHAGRIALDRLVLRRKEKIGDTGVTLGSIIDYVSALEAEIARRHSEAERPSKAKACPITRQAI